MESVFDQIVALPIQLLARQHNQLPRLAKILKGLKIILILLFKLSGVDANEAMLAGM